MRDEASVLFANDAFYEAFRQRDLETMDKLWARRRPVACTHPGWRTLIGREEVMESWAGILGNPGSPAITCRNAIAFVEGDSAFVTCYEAVGGNVLAATNIFTLEDGQWRLVHHQAGPSELPLSALDDAPEPGPVQ
ncbi:MAG: nuclear transport factor 2 family protein [Kiloniellales bacterium]